jgi:hypothetical protein
MPLSHKAEVTTSVQRLSPMSQEELQKLFNHYNRKYWRARLPVYAVAVSTRHNGGYCDKRLRVIFIHPNIASEDQDAKRTLLHEMSHAAVSSGHGKLWKAEMRRLRRRGAPIRERDMTDYETKNALTPTYFLRSIFDAGVELPNETWSRIKRSFGYQNGLVDDQGRANDRRAAHLLEKCRYEFIKGQREGRQMRELRLVQTAAQKPGPK